MYKLKERIMSNIPTAEEWLTHEDEICRQDRLVRLNWLASKVPDTKYWIFPGGIMAKYLFEETRYCFVYGQFLSTIVLGLSYIEHTLASLLYGAGRNDLERSSISTLLQEALNYGWINQDEFDNIEHARVIRNPNTHFRRPGDDDTIGYRMVQQNKLPYMILEEDAKHVIEVVLRLLTKNAV